MACFTLILVLVLVLLTITVTITITSTSASITSIIPISTITTMITQKQVITCSFVMPRVETGLDALAEHQLDELQTSLRSTGLLFL